MENNSRNLVFMSKSYIEMNFSDKIIPYILETIVYETRNWMLINQHLVVLYIQLYFSYCNYLEVFESFRRNSNSSLYHSIVQLSLHENIKKILELM